MTTSIIRQKKLQYTLLYIIYTYKIYKLYFSYNNGLDFSILLLSSY